jgi:hypothetical protein
VIGAPQRPFHEDHYRLTNPPEVLVLRETAKANRGCFALQTRPLAQMIFFNIEQGLSSMADYILVLGKKWDRIVRSDGAVRSRLAGKMLPFFKASKIKLVTIEFEGEFDIQFRNRVERFLVDSHWTFWDGVDFESLTQDELMQLIELEKSLPTEPTPEPTEEEQAMMEAHAARLREIVSQPGYRFKAITNDPSSEIEPSPGEGYAKRD